MSHVVIGKLNLFMYIIIYLYAVSCLHVHVVHVCCIFRYLEAAEISVSDEENASQLGKVSLM